VVGDISNQKVKDLVQLLEAQEGRELTYTTMKYDEFYYRLSVHDRFIQSVITNKHSVLLDTDNILKEQ
jgi:transposase